MKHKTLLSRREMLKSAALAAAVPMINRGRFRLFASTTTEYSRQAIDLIGRATVIDMLNVLTLDFNKQAAWFKNPESFTASDLQPYLESGINVMHPAVGMGGPNAYETALQFFASWNGFIASKETLNAYSHRSGISHKKAQKAHKKKD